MPHCDVCLTECDSVGLLSCRHNVCRRCGMSQNSCLVCARIGGKNRRRLSNRTLPLTRPGPNEVFTPSKESTPELVITPLPKTPRTHTLSPLLRQLPVRLPAATADSPDRKRPQEPKRVKERSAEARANDRKFDVKRAEGRRVENKRNHDAIRGPEPVVNGKTGGSVNGKEKSHLNPPSKKPRVEKSTESNADCKLVHAPTAFDEVRCELRPSAATPSLQRNALRTTGKLTIDLLAQFVHGCLKLAPSQSVLFRCSGEELTGAITLGHLVSHVWPESDGHMVLDYRVSQSLADKAS